MKFYTEIMVSAEDLRVAFRVVEDLYIKMGGGSQAWTREQSPLEALSLGKQLSRDARRTPCARKNAKLATSERH